MKGLNFRPGSKAHKRKYVQPLVRVSAATPQDELKDRISNAFPIGQTVFVGAKQQSVEFDKGHVTFTIKVIEVRSSKPSYDPTMLPYLVLVNPDDAFVKSYLKRTIRVKHTKNLVFEMLCDPKVGTRPAFRVADEIKVVPVVAPEEVKDFISGDFMGKYRQQLKLHKERVAEIAEKDR